MDSPVQGRADGSSRPRAGGRGAKSAGAFRTISEVADELDVAQHVLRFWESKFPQVRPLKRGGGRRYYRPEDVDLLRRIRSLLYEEGYTIKGAQKLLKGQRRPPTDRTERAPVAIAADGDAGPDEAAAERSASTRLDPAVKRTLDALRSELTLLRDALRNSGH